MRPNLSRIWASTMNDDVENRLHRSIKLFKRQSKNCAYNCFIIGFIIAASFHFNESSHLYYVSIATLGDISNYYIISWIMSIQESAILQVQKWTRNRANPAIFRGACDLSKWPQIRDETRRVTSSCAADTSTAERSRLPTNSTAKEIVQKQFCATAISPNLQ